MALRIYNTETKKKEEFIPLQQGKVGMYVCGPTVYDRCHVGHARSYVAFDVIRRYFEYKGYKVTYIQNFTDVDDKIINRAREEEIPPLVLSERYIQEYFRDMDQLNIGRATVHPKASEMIPDMINVIRGLIEGGFAYEAQGDVYFDVERAKDRFGTLRHQSLDEMKDGARIEVDPKKKNPKDFALWKSAKQGEISWPSPWGEGRPGWHIECSTMATKYLGPTLDIHGGGMDLIFPHHESEILQSECFHGRKFVRYWLHNGFVEINSEKMSKSLKNFFSIREVLDRFPPMVLRFFLVYTHYRSPIDFSDVALEEAQRSHGRLSSLHSRLSQALEGFTDDELQEMGPADGRILDLVFRTKADFMEAMDDDFNTRVAVASLFSFDSGLKEIGGSDGLEPSDTRAALSLLEELSDVLGLRYGQASPEDALGGGMASELVQVLIDLRDRAREKKDWETSDGIRARLRELGIVLEDGDRTTWRLVRPEEERRGDRRP